MSDIKPPAQPQRTQSAEGFLASEENRTGLARTSTLTWQAMCEFAEAYAQSLQQAAAPTGKCGLPHSLPTVYHPCCLAKGHNPEDMHLFMPIQVSETYYCTPAPQPVADPSKEELVIEIAPARCLSLLPLLIVTIFCQCGCRHEWHAIPRMSAVPERGAPPEKENSNAD